MTFQQAVKRYKEACRLALMTPAAIKKSFSVQRGDRWVLVASVRGDDRAEVGIVTPDECLIGGRLHEDDLHNE